MHTANISSAIAPINVSHSTDLTPIFYKDHPVITMSMIDKAHQRPSGTAGRNFRQNRDKLIEGEDYFRVCADEIRRHKIFELSSRAHEDINLLTETGYLMLVKSFTDDLAWKVQRKLVKGYFRAKERRPASADFSLTDLTVRLANAVVPMIKTHSLRQAYVIANHAIQADTGIDVLAHWPISLDEIDGTLPTLPGRKLPKPEASGKNPLDKLARYLRNAKHLPVPRQASKFTAEIIARLLGQGYIPRQVLLKRMHCTAAEFNMLIAEGKEAGIVRELDGIEFNYAGVLYVAGGAA